MKPFVKKILSAAVIATSLVAMLAVLFSCNKEEEKIKPKNRIFYEYFDTVSVIYDYTGGTEEEFSAVVELIHEELEICHKLFDIYNEYEGIINLKKINDASGGEPVKVDERIIDLLDFSLEMYRLTDGGVNVAMGAVLSLWHTLREEGKRIPTEEELSAASEHIDIEKLVINKAESTVCLTDSGMSLDVGAIAKGYTAERIAEMLAERGISGYALDFGGNLRVVGEKPNGDGWKSGIRNPDPLQESSYVRTLTIKDSALVTSGVYERFYTVDGVRYHHIIDKDTLMPENNYLSLTVHAPSSAVADALSTAVFNMTFDEAQTLADELGNVEFTFVTASGEVIVISSDI